MPTSFDFDSALETATDTANGAFHTAADAIEAAEGLTALAADKLVEGAVLAAASSRWRSKRVALALLVLAAVAGALIWRRRSDDGTDAENQVS